MAVPRSTSPSSAAAPGPGGRRTGSLGAGSLVAGSLVAVALVPVAAYLVVALRRIGYPYELSYFEGSMVEVTARVAAGQPIFAPPTTDFVPWPYPPLYFWLSAGVARAVGTNLLALRLVSLLASLVVLVLIAVIVRRAGASMVAGVVAAGVYAATYRVSGAWADTARVDSLLLALLLAAILAGQRSQTWRGGLGVSLLFFLAFMTKQNALLVAVPVLLWLLVRRRPVGVAASAGLAGAIVASTVVGNALTDGWYAPSVVGQLLGQPLAPRWLVEFWAVDVLFPFAIMIMAGGWLAVRRGADLGIARAWLPMTSVSYLAAAVAGLLLTALAGRLHDGGYANVAMPAHAGVAIAAGLALAGLMRSTVGTPRALVAVTAVLAVQFAIQTLWRVDVLPTAADRAAGDAFIARVRDLPRAVLIPSHSYYLRLAGLPTHASLIAIDDALLASGGRVREATAAALPWSLTGVDAVILDSAADADLFGAALTRDFTLLTENIVPAGDFIPVTDTPRRPSLLYVRTSLVAAG